MRRQERDGFHVGRESMSRIQLAGARSDRPLSTHRKCVATQPAHRYLHVSTPFFRIGILS